MRVADKFISICLSRESAEYLASSPIFRGVRSESRKIRYILEEVLDSSVHWKASEGFYQVCDIRDMYKNLKFTSLGYVVGFKDDTSGVGEVKKFTGDMLYRLEPFFFSHDRPFAPTGFRTSFEMWESLLQYNIPLVNLVDRLILRHKFFSTMTDQEAYYYRSWLSSLRSSNKIKFMPTMRHLTIASILGTGEDTYISCILLRYILNTRNNPNEKVYLDVQDAILATIEKEGDA